MRTRKVVALGSGFGWEGALESPEPDALEVPEPPNSLKPPPDPPMPPVPPKLNTHAATTKPTIKPPKIRQVRNSGVGTFLNAIPLARALTSQPVPRPPTATAPTTANDRTANVPTSSMANIEKWPTPAITNRPLSFGLVLATGGTRIQHGMNNPKSLFVTLFRV